MKKIILVTVVAVLCIGTDEVKALILDDGGVHTIDYQLDDNVWVEDSPLDEFTTLNIVDGGIIRDWVNVLDYSQVNMSGGSIGFVLFTWDNSRADLSGGSIAVDLYATDYGQVDISGGSIGEIISAREYSQITIFGNDFEVDGNPIGYGPITEGTINELGMLTGTLTGTLVNGDFLNNAFDIDPDATIILVPEPATLLLIGIGVLCLRRRNRT
jgi:hypothetical protein